MHIRGLSSGDSRNPYRGRKNKRFRFSDEEGPLCAWRLSFKPVNVIDRAGGTRASLPRQRWGHVNDALREKTGEDRAFDFNRYGLPAMGRVLSRCPSGCIRSSAIRDSSGLACRPFAVRRKRLLLRRRNSLHPDAMGNAASLIATKGLWSRWL